MPEQDAGASSVEIGGSSDPPSGMHPSHPHLLTRMVAGPATTGFDSHICNICRADNVRTMYRDAEHDYDVCVPCFRAALPDEADASMDVTEEKPADLGPVADKEVVRDFVGQLLPMLSRAFQSIHQVYVHIDETC